MIGARRIPVADGVAGSPALLRRCEDCTPRPHHGSLRRGPVGRAVPAHGDQGRAVRGFPDGGAGDQ